MPGRRTSRRSKQSKRNKRTKQTKPTKQKGGKGENNNVPSAYNNLEPPPAYNAPPNYYATLGVSQNATEKNINKAYDHQKTLYGNKGSSPDPSMMDSVQQAYDILSNPKKRAEYAQTLANYDTSNAGIAVVAAATAGAKTMIPSPKTRILIIVLIGFIVLLIAGFFWVEGNISTINMNWEEYRCRPYVFPFVGWLVGPPGVTMANNTGHCLWELQKGFFWILMHPFLAIFGAIKDVLKIIRDAIVDIWETINFVREVVVNIASDIYIRLRNTFMRVSFLFNTMLRLVNRVFITLGDVLSLATNAFYTMASLWNGILGKMIHFMRFFCNHEDNLVALQSSPTTYKSMSLTSQTALLRTPVLKEIKDVKIGDTLSDGSIVTGIVKYAYIHPQTKKPTSQLYLYRNNLISGSHIVENDEHEWVRCDSVGTPKHITTDQLSKSHQSHLYCLITDTGYVTMKDHVQMDYFEYFRPENLNQSSHLEILYKYILTYLNNGSLSRLTMERLAQSAKYLSTRPNQKHTSLWGLHPNSKLLLRNGTVKNIKDIQIGDILSSGKPVLGVSSFVVSPNNNTINQWFEHAQSGLVGTKNLIIKENGKYIPLNHSHSVRSVTESNNTMAYNLVVDGNEFTCMGVTVRDFEIVEDVFIDNEIYNFTDNQVINRSISEPLTVQN